MDEVNIYANATVAACEALLEVANRFEATANATPSELDGAANTAEFATAINNYMAALRNAQQQALKCVYHWADQWASGPGEANALAMQARQGFTQQ